MIQIRPNIYIASIDAIPLLSPNIRAIVSLLTPPLSSYPQLQPPPPDHLYVPISDTPGDCLLTTLRSTLPFIHHHRSHGVLIHCFNGISRSVATIVAYLIWTDSTKLPCQHLQDVREKYPAANPLPAFLRQLEAFSASRTQFPQKYVFPPKQRRLHPLEATELLLLIKHSDPGDFVQLFLSDPVKNDICSRCRLCRQPLLPDKSVLGEANQNRVSILPVKWMVSCCVHRSGKLRCQCGAKIGRFDLDVLSFEVVSSSVDWNMTDLVLKR